MDFLENVLPEDSLLFAGHLFISGLTLSAWQTCAGLTVGALGLLPHGTWRPQGRWGPSQSMECVCANQEKAPLPGRTKFKKAWPSGWMNFKRHSG